MYSGNTGLGNMEQSVRLTPITITGSAEPKDNAFSKTFFYRPPDADLHAHRGELYACLSLASPDPSLDLENLTNQILTYLSESYFNQKEGSVLETISMASNSAQKRALELTRREGGQIPLDFSLTAAAIWGKTAFVSLLGGSFIGLFRGGEFLPETTNRLFSEELKDKDVLILATPLFVTRIGEEKIAEILRQFSPQEWMEKFREMIITKEEQSRLAALFLQVEIEEVPGEEEIIEILEVPRQQSLMSKLKEKAQGLVKNFQKLIPILPKIWNRIWALLHHKKETAVYLKEQKPDGRRKKFALIGMLSVLLIISILGTRWWNKRNERKKEVQNLLSQVQEKISESEKTATSNPGKTKKLLEEAQGSLGKVKGMQVAKKEIEDLETKMGEILEKAYNTEKLEPQLIADLNLKIEGGNFQEVIRLGEKLYSLDTKSGKIVEVNLEEENKIQLIPTTNYQPLTTNQLLAGYLDSLYIFDPKQGIIEMNRRTGTTEVAIPTDLNWKEITGLETYLGNLYLLDPPSNRIFKYLSIETGFSRFFDYFSQNVNLTGVRSLTVDGAIYLLFTDGRIEKYLGGTREEFNLSGLYPSLSDASQIYTNPDAENLYFISANSVLIFRKDGTYQKRLQIQGISKIDDFVTEEKGGKIWFLAEGKVYEILPNP